ncbi:MAG: guanylate kinase [Zoogloeaceae bacterium]|jgi:guanylate kinase|nr:guanylate kinase [Zoogloeaceae bacterium]
MAGLLFVVAAPSGAGKTTLVRRLLAKTPEIALSVSTTTRPPRAGEMEGRDYHFVSAPEFLARRDAGEFLEWAKVHDNFYGTSKRWIEEKQARGEDVLLEIDWQGAAQVRRFFPEAVGIFILPPSQKILAERLFSRGTDSDEVIRRRLAAAEEEIRHAAEFDYAIINADLEMALADFSAIVKAARLTVARQRARYPELFV